MPEEIGRTMLEFPMSSASAVALRKNMVVLQDHRDLLVRIDYPRNTQFRLYSPDKRFYDPVGKKEIHEYAFSSGEEVHLWLSKFHDSDLLVQRVGGLGWETLSSLAPRTFDQTDYSHEHARPAPIVFKVGPEGIPLGGALPERAPKGTVSDEYKAELAKSHTASAGELLKKWEDNKNLPLMTRAEGMRSCHAYPEDVEVDMLVEILPSTELYTLLPDADHERGGTIGSSEAARTAADVILNALGQVAEKGALARDLWGVQFHITVQRLSTGQVKKFIVFKGYAGVRRLIRGTRYAVGNVRVITLSARHLRMGQLAGESARSVAGVFNPVKSVSGRVAVIAVLLDTAQWMAEGGKDVERLFAKISVTVLTAAITCGLAPFVAAVVGGALAAVGVAVSAGAIALMVGGAVIILGVLVGWALAYTPLEDWLYNLYKKLRKAWAGDLEQVGYSIAAFHDC